MGTEKRERQKANRAKKQAELAKVERTNAVKRNVVRWALVLVAAFAAVLLIAWVGGAFSGDDEPELPPTIPIDVTLPDTTPATTIPAPTTTGG